MISRLYKHTHDLDLVNNLFDVAGQKTLGGEAIGAHQK